jgi:hypothetical protein
MTIDKDVADCKREIKALWSALNKNVAELNERIQDSDMRIDDDKLQSELDYQSEDLPEEPCGCDESVELKAYLGNAARIILDMLGNKVGSTAHGEAFVDLAHRRGWLP